MDEEVDFVFLCALANMPRLLHTVASTILQRSANVTGVCIECDSEGDEQELVRKDCSTSDGYMWHLVQTLDDGRSLGTARVLHGETSPIATTIEHLLQVTERRCGPLNRGADRSTEALLSLPALAGGAMCGAESAESCPQHAPSMDDGGWRVGEAAGVAERCDIVELHHLPSKSEFSTLLMSARPIVIRGGAASKMGLNTDVSGSFHFYCIS